MAEPVYESFQVINGLAFEYAGTSVAMTPAGEYIAVGFKEANGPVTEKTGQARVYRRTIAGSYSPLGDIIFGNAAGDEFGSAIGIANDGQRVAVAARSSSSLGKQKNGQVKVFEYSEASNSWNQLGSTIEGLEERDRLGFSISLSGGGQRVAIGAPRGNGGTGSASIYEFNGLDWVQIGAVNGDEIGDRAGFSVSLSNDGNALAVGAILSSDSRGSVAIYKLDNSLEFALVNQGQTLLGQNNGDQFGYSVSLSGDGQRIVIGSNGFEAKSGKCEVYEYQEQSWIPTGALIGNGNEEAGSHVSISKNGQVFSCTKGTDINGLMVGTVVVMEDNGLEWSIIDTITSSLESSASFGASTSISQDGNLVLAGDPSYDSSSGFFEVFTRLD